MIQNALNSTSQIAFRICFHNKNKIGIVIQLGRSSCLSSMKEKNWLTILNLELGFFEMTVKKVKKLAYDFAKEAYISHNLKQKRKRE